MLHSTLDISINADKLLSQHWWIIISIINMGWTYFSIPKLQWGSRWSLGMNEYFQPTLYWVRDYLSMLGLKSIHDDKTSPLSLFHRYWRGHASVLVKHRWGIWVYKSRLWIIANWDDFPKYASAQTPYIPRNMYRALTRMCFVVIWYRSSMYIVSKDTALALWHSND